ncbi:MAG: hypothetical protein QWI73_07010, partial [Alphaproteobacteria bacterium]|nr:hypothetical protein [Alphaproteobacteria bacterium]
HHIAHSKMLKGGGCLSSEAKQKVYQSVEPNSTARQLLLAFSIRANMRKIFAVQRPNRDVHHIVDSNGRVVEYQQQQSRKSSSIEVFHGIKFFAMIWIIFSHSISFSSQWINFSE